MATAQENRKKALTGVTGQSNMIGFGLIIPFLYSDTA